MKILLTILIGLAILVVSYYIFQTYMKEHKLASCVRNVLLVGFVVLTANLVMTIWSTKLISSICYCIYFVATDWLLYWFLRFSFQYTGVAYNKVLRDRLLCALLLADSLSLIINLFTNKLFVVVPSDTEGFFEIETTLFFFIHYLIILSLAVSCVVTLVVKATKAAAFYRARYLYIAGGICAIVLMNVLTYRSDIDYSIFGYAIESIIIFYCTFAFYSKKLVQKTLYEMTKNMEFGLLVLDVEGRLLYTNQSMERLLQSDVPVLSEDNEGLFLWCQKLFEDKTVDFEDNVSFHRGRKSLILQVHYQRLYDEKDRFQGAYFILHDETIETEKLEHERYVAVHDSLTGLYNKEHFLLKARQRIDNNPQLEYKIVCNDIKDFKLINDSFGLQAGDNVLMNIAKMIRSYADDSIVYGRIGSDVFGFLIPQNEAGDVFFEKLTSDKFLEFINMQTTYVLAYHYGIYEIKDRSVPVSVMCDRARRAIQQIKNDYNKKIAYYDENMRENAMQEQELLSELEDALKAKVIQVYIQPQVTKDRKVFGGEALVRWVHPQKGQILPGKFIPVLEQNGLISEVDKYVWDAACRQLQKWKNEGREELYLSVNISPKDFYFLDIYTIFTELITRYGISAKNLHLEITESALSVNIERQLELINKLRAFGFSVEMDDFGSGYSSLNMLKDTNVDTLKVDMGFLQSTQELQKSRKILEMIIELCKKLELHVIVEGVETAEQVDFLSKLGTDVFQGYYFAKPMPVEEFEQKYLK